MTYIILKIDHLKKKTLVPEQYILDLLTSIKIDVQNLVLEYNYNQIVFIHLLTMIDLPSYVTCVPSSYCVAYYSMSFYADVKTRR